MGYVRLQLLQPFPLCKQEKFLVFDQGVAMFTGCDLLQFPDTGLKYRPYPVCNAHSYCRKRFRKRYCL